MDQIHTLLGIRPWKDIPVFPDEVSLVYNDTGKDAVSVQKSLSGVYVWAAYGRQACKTLGEGHGEGLPQCLYAAYRCLLANAA